MGHPGSGKAQLRDPAWRGRVALLVLALVLAWPLRTATEWDFARLFDGSTLRAAGAFLAGFLPPDLSGGFLLVVAEATWRTVAMATAGVTLALLFAVALCLVATGALSISAIGGRRAAGPMAVRGAARAFMAALRTVPELVWALLLVRVVGLGPTAGVLAIAFTYAGMLGKVYAEILESCDAHAASLVLVHGGGRLQAFFYALLPQSAGELTSYTVYRWECAIRSSVVLGFVGAGGLGQQIDTSMKMLAGGEVATLLLVFFLLVGLADHVSARLRASLR